MPIKPSQVKRPKRSKKDPVVKAPKEDLSAGYNKYKEYKGQQYTGMKIGRHHKWYYDKGEWKEQKLTPDKWGISFAVTKRRAGKAPEGSGVPVGTEYHWYILADQEATKLDANSYATKMTGYKFKLAHKRADKDKWSLSSTGQRKKLIKILQEMISQLEEEIVEEKENKTLKPATETKPERIK
jgi:hypothetical protein